MVKNKVRLLSVLVCLELFFLMPCYAQYAKTYTNEILNISLRFPVNYSLKHTAGGVFFMSPKEGNNDLFLENVGILVEGLGNTGIGLKRYFEQAQENAMKSFPNFKMISKKMTAINRLKAYEAIFTSGSPKLPFKIMQVVIVHKNYAYVITYSALAKDYRRHLPEALFIIKSFRILE